MVVMAVMVEMVVMVVIKWAPRPAPLELTEAVTDGFAAVNFDSSLALVEAEFEAEHYLQFVLVQKPGTVQAVRRYRVHVLHVRHVLLLLVVRLLLVVLSDVLLDVSESLASSNFHQDDKVNLHSSPVQGYSVVQH